MQVLDSTSNSRMIGRDRPDGWLVYQCRYPTAGSLRFGRSVYSALVGCLVVFFLGNSLMFIFGAPDVAALGKADISDVMTTQCLLVPAILVLDLNIWTTNDNNLYFFGPGFTNINRPSSHFLSMLNGALGTLAALWLYNHLTFLSAAISPIGGVIIANYLSRRCYRQYPRESTNHQLVENPCHALRYHDRLLVAEHRTSERGIRWPICCSTPWLNRKISGEIIHADQ